MEKIID